jgi:hypothetical protein
MRQKEQSPSPHERLGRAISHGDAKICPGCFRLETVCLSEQQTMGLWKYYLRVLTCANPEACYYYYYYYDDLACENPRSKEKPLPALYEKYCTLSLPTFPCCVVITVQVVLVLSSLLV